MEGAKHVHVLSLGSSCFPAAYLRDRQLRCYAGPFDWIFSSPRVVSSCLQDDFESFLDTAQYRDCGQAGRAGHELFSKLLGKATIFNHHDPRVPEHHDYFCRAVDRFRKVLQTPADGAAKVFLLCSLEVGFHLDEAELLELFHELCLRTSSFALVAIRLACSTDDDVSLPRVTLQAHQKVDCGTLHLYDMVLRGAHEGLRLQDGHDREAFDKLLQPWFDGHVSCSDPLERSALRASEHSHHTRPLALPVPPPFEDASPLGRAFAAWALEIVRPPRDDLSPDLKPLSLDCQVVLKESVAQRVLQSLAGQSGEKGYGGRRCRRMTVTADTWIATDGAAETTLGVRQHWRWSPRLCSERGGERSARRWSTSCGAGQAFEPRSCQKRPWRCSAPQASPSPHTRS